MTWLGAEPTSNGITSQQRGHVQYAQECVVQVELSATASSSTTALKVKMNTSPMLKKCQEWE